MGYAYFFLYRFLPIIFLLIGIILLLVLGLLSSKITKKIPRLLTRMRVVYGYVAIICTMISLVSFAYIYKPIDITHNVILKLEITPFAKMLYFLIGSVIVVASFITILETSIQYKNSYLLFIPLLLLQSSILFILASNSWIYVLFGFILVYFSINAFLRIFADSQTEKEKDTYKNYLKISSLSIIFLFIGIASHAISGNMFALSSLSTIHSFWEYFSIIFIIISLLILIGGPPFHFWFFETENEKHNTTSLILLTVQRGVALAFLTKYLLSLKDSNISQILLWLMVILGAVYTLWGVLGSFASNRLQHLIHYISLTYVGFLFMLLSDIFSEGLFSQNLWAEYLTSSSTAAVFMIFAYIPVITFSIALTNLVSKEFKTDEIKILADLGRYSIARFLLMTFNTFLLFGLPLATFILSPKFRVKFYYTSSMYVTTIIFYIGLILSLVYIIRMLKQQFAAEPRRALPFNSTERAAFLSMLLAFCIVVIMLIFSIQIFEMCKNIITNSLG